MSTREVSNLNAGEKQAFIAAVAAQRGKRLRRFLLARVRNAADAADLVQEVFLRLLRIPDHEPIRMPEAYVFALANHVLYQHRRGLRVVYRHARWRCG